MHGLRCCWWGRATRFPMVHNNRTYTSCVSDGHAAPWCYTLNGQWGNCECPTSGGTSERGTVSAPCQLPMQYKGKWHNGCTAEDNSEPWCYTQAGAGQWANCLYDGPFFLRVVKNKVCE